MKVDQYWPGNCFGCSPTNPQGLQLRFWVSEQGCFTQCTIPNHLCGFDGLVHGGIIATLLDEVAAWTIIAHLGRVGITREMLTRFLKPVPTNTELVVEGQVINHDERNAVLHCAIRSADGTLLAEGESKWVLPRLSTIASLLGIDEQTVQKFLGTAPANEGDSD